MRDRDESRRQGYGPRGEEGDTDQWRHREDQDEWRHGSRWMHGSDRGWDRSGGGWGGGGWRPEDRGARWDRDDTGYGQRGGEGYQGGYNMGMNYGQGGPQGQGFGSGQPLGGPGYRGPGHGGGDREARGDHGYAGGGPGTGGHTGHSYGGFGGQGYSRGEGSWRQGRWEPGPVPRAYAQTPRHPYDEDRGDYLQRGFGMSPYGAYGAREQGAYGGDEDRGTWGGASWPGGGPFVSPGGGYTGRHARAPRGYQRSDDRIREDVCETIVRMGIDAGDVDIRVDRSEVTLSGTVANRQDKRRLEDLAEAVSGVKHVHNQLRIEEPQRTQTGSASASGEMIAAGYGSTAAGKNAGPQNTNTNQNNRTQ